METHVLGRTGLDVSRLSMGGLFVSAVGAEFEEARKAVNRAVELGCNYVDTAPGYANSEEVLGRILPDLEAPLILATKLGGRPQPFEPKNRDGLMQSVEESLRLLKRDTIDILMIHEPDRPGQYDWWDDYDNFTGPVLDLLNDLKKDGTIGYTGLGGTTPYMMARLIRTGNFDVVLTAFNYSLLWREAELEVLPAAREQNVGVVIGSPLQQGALAVRHDELMRKGHRLISESRRRQFLELYALADELDMTLPELALRFVISNPDVDTVLMGARSVTEVEQNVESINRGSLPGDVMQKLDDIAAQVPFRPMDEPFGLGWNLGSPDDYKGPGPAA